MIQQNWAKAGVKNIKDLMNDEYEVITFRNFKEKYCFPVSFLEFYGVASAIRFAMNSDFENEITSENDQGISVQKLIAATKLTKLAYEILINKKSTLPKKSQAKWERDCKLQAVEDLKWTFIYSLPRMCTISTKLRNFRFKFLHRSIATNIGYSSLLCVQNRRGNTNSSLLGMISYKNLLAKCERILRFNPSYTSLARFRHV